MLKYVIPVAVAAAVTLLASSFNSKAWLEPTVFEAAYRNDLGTLINTACSAVNATSAGDSAELPASAASFLLTSRDTFGNTALHWAAKSSASHVLPYMLALPHADANVKNAAGTTPLHWAAAAGDAATVQQLLAAGADPNVASARGDRPLHWAVEWLNVPTLRTLLATRSPHAATASAHAPAAAAASAASAASVADVSAVDEQGDTPLHRVSANCHHEWRCARIVALLIRSGAEMSRPNKHGRTPQQHFDLTVAPPQSDRELDDLALDDGPTEITVNNAATSGEHIGDFPVVDGAAAAAAAAVAEPAEQDESDDSALLDSAARRSKKLGKVPPA